MKIKPELKVGFLFCLSLAILGVLIARAEELPFLSRTYILKARFDDARGLERTAPVYFSGIKVGKVYAVKINGTDIIVSLQIDRSIRIPVNSLAKITTFGFFAEKVVAITPQDKDTKAYLAAGDFIETAKPVELSDLFVQLNVTLSSFQNIVHRIEAGEGTLGKLVNDDALYVELKKTVRQIGEVATGIQDKSTLGNMATILFNFAE